MLKKIFFVAIVGLTIFFTPAQVFAEEIFVGTSPATEHKCYVLTETVSRKTDMRTVIISVTLKTVSPAGNVHYIDYQFFAPNADFDNVHFSNSEGFTGQANAQDTPIEWATYLTIRYY